jgi:prepilin-type N-terminal cleavage/methylation domain-containing protein
MLRRPSPRILTQLRGEHGFTLIESLVAMAAGLVVAAGMLAVLQVSLNQNQRITDQLQANRAGRTALTYVLDQLHSSCTGSGSTAIQAPATTPTSPLAGTGAANLWFISAYSSSSSQNAAIQSVALHDINWASTGTSNTGETLGTLTDYSWNSTNTTNAVPPLTPWTFNSVLSPATASAKRVLATRVVQITEPSTPIFSYSKYDTNSADAANGKYGTLQPIPSGELPLSSTLAMQVGQVAIAYKQAPTDGDTRKTHTTNFSASVALRLDPTESRGEGGQCQ